MPSLSFPGRAVRRPGFLKTTFCPQAGSEKIPQTSVCPKQRWLVGGGGRTGGFLLFLLKLTFTTTTFLLAWLRDFSQEGLWGLLCPHTVPEAREWQLDDPGRRAPLRTAAMLSHPLLCFSFPDPVPVQPPGLRQHKQASGCRTRTARASEERALSFRLPASPSLHRPPHGFSPLQESCLLPEWEEGSRKCARSWPAQCFPLGGNAAFFTFNPEKYGSQKACF